MLPGNQILKSLELLTKVELDDGSVTENSGNVNEKFSASGGGKKTCSYRYTNADGPMSDWGHTMFADKKEPSRFFADSGLQ